MSPTNAEAVTVVKSSAQVHFSLSFPAPAATAAAASSATGSSANANATPSAVVNTATSGAETEDGGNPTLTLLGVLSIIPPAAMHGFLRKSEAMQWAHCSWGCLRALKSFPLLGSLELHLLALEQRRSGAARLWSACQRGAGRHTGQQRRCNARRTATQCHDSGA